jgi:hypothetical protein
MIITIYLKSNYIIKMKTFEGHIFLTKKYRRII